MAAPSRTMTLADGQLAASSGTLLAFTEDHKATLTFFNTSASDSQTVAVSLSVAGGTSRQIVQAVLLAKETLIISNLPVQAGDTLSGSSTNATTVNYIVSGQGGGDFRISVLDANGVPKSSSAAVGSGNFTVSGDLTISGGDIDAGASGTAGSVDIFPTTASKGKVALTAADSAGDTTTTIVNASQAGARTYTIPDAGGSTSFAMCAGAQTIAGAKTFSTMPIIPSATVAAAGNAQGNAAAITTGFTLVTAADGTKGVVLPAAAAGLMAIVKNDDAANAILKVYPASSDAINALSADAALSMAAKTSALFVAYDATTWYTLPLLPS